MDGDRPQSSSRGWQSSGNPPTTAPTSRPVVFTSSSPHQSSSSFTPVHPKRKVYPPGTSVSLTAPYLEVFFPPSHTKHLGCEGSIPQLAPLSLFSDRHPEAVRERLSRRSSHQLALSLGGRSAFSRSGGGAASDSFSAQAVQTKIVKSLLGESRPVRDPLDRAPPPAGFSYSRVPTQVDDRPDCYDFDDCLFSVRSRGYSPGNLRSLSPPPREVTARWLDTLPSMDSSVLPDNEAFRDRGSEHLPTRYSTIALGKDWSKFRTERVKRNMQKKKVAMEQKVKTEERQEEARELFDSIALFEKNLGGMRKQRR